MYLMGSRRSSGFRSLLLLLLLAVVSECIHLSGAPVLAAAADRTPSSKDHNAIAHEGELGLAVINSGQLASVSKIGGGGGRGGGGGGGGGGFRGGGGGRGGVGGRGRGGFFGWLTGGAEKNHNGVSVIGHLALAFILAAALLV